MNDISRREFIKTIAGSVFAGALAPEASKAQRREQLQYNSLGLPILPDTLAKRVEGIDVNSLETALIHSKDYAHNSSQQIQDDLYKVIRQGIPFVNPWGEQIGVTIPIFTAYSGLIKPDGQETFLRVFEFWRRDDAKIVIQKFDLSKRYKDPKNPLGSLSVAEQFIGVPDRPFRAEQVIRIYCPTDQLLQSMKQFPDITYFINENYYNIIFCKAHLDNSMGSLAEPLKWGREERDELNQLAAAYIAEAWQCNLERRSNIVTMRQPLRYLKPENIIFSGNVVGAQDVTSDFIPPSSPFDASCKMPRPALVDAKADGTLFIYVYETKETIPGENISMYNHQNSGINLYVGNVSSDGAVSFQPLRSGYLSRRKNIGPITMREFHPFTEGAESLIAASKRITNARNQMRNIISELSDKGCHVPPYKEYLQYTKKR
jgi:hypothetical protein